MTARTLVARLDSMGDVLLAGPAVRAVAACGEVVLLCGPRGADAAHLLPGVTDIIVWDAPWISNPAPAASPDHTGTLLRALHAARITDAVILTSFHQSPLPLALLLRAVGVTRITGASVDYAGSLLDTRLRPGEDLPENIPEPERALRIADAAGFPAVDDGRLRVTLPTTAGVAGQTEGAVVLHPGAAVPARRWPAGAYARVAALLADRGVPVVVTGGPDEIADTRAVTDAHPAVVDLVGQLTLAELGETLAHAAALVSGNTGPAHLAAAVGTPVVSLFSPVVPASRWAPYGVPTRILGDQNAPCRGTRARECPVAGHPCLTTVRPDEVVRAIVELTETVRSHA